MNFEEVVDPLLELDRWRAQAEADGVQLPEAMTLATVTPEGWPAARVVLLKGRRGRELHFFTNYQSSKAVELEHNPRAEAVFHYAEAARQVRVRGLVSRLPREESEAYFATRPRESQIGAWASRQSQPVASRRELDEAAMRIRDEFAARAVPCPPHWGGYVLRAERVELWLGRAGRIHDRASYALTNEGSWRCQRLYP